MIFQSFIKLNLFIYLFLLNRLVDQEIQKDASMRKRT